ncbi:hypothetical protein NDN08_004483 [Rhodosorus marinus]|uniref:Phospholipid/glycerol acyltransferase domain-containing protein n=1 Tax=Rhodosorus marinus TaxID=101924 RepID=A0AAV8ULE4_9RHOD|nr:hypothetical protein NDN08_004483 [Rhodosorus marinus]
MEVVEQVAAEPAEKQEAEVEQPVLEETEPPELERFTRKDTLEHVTALISKVVDLPDDMLSGVIFGDEYDRQEIQQVIENATYNLVTPKIPLDLNLALPTFGGAMEDIVQDSFNKCFEAHLPVPWNWNAYLLPAYLLGIFVRYFVLFPIRLTILIWSIIAFLVISTINRKIEKDEQKAIEKDRKLMWYLANAWIMALGGVIQYSGVAPTTGAKQVYVSNHTSIIDYVVLLGAQTFAVVGQHHPQPLAFFQDVVLKCLSCIWFDRKELKDRGLVRNRIQEHVNRADVAPLLIFPEGTCVNNHYTVMFKKGAFELDAEVCPVTLKYNNIFVDAFWDTRNVSFLRYLFELLTSWALICDVTFLERQKIQPGETPVEFAQRVQTLISDVGGLEATQFNGYFKHIRADKKFIAQRQKETAQTMLRSLKLQKTLGDEKVKKIALKKTSVGKQSLTRRNV